MKDAEKKEKALTLLADYQEYLVRLQSFLNQSVPVQGNVLEAVEYYADHPSQIGQLTSLRHHMPVSHLPDGNIGAIGIPDELPLYTAVFTLEAYKRKSTSNMIFGTDTGDTQFSIALAAAFRAALNPALQNQLEQHLGQTLKCFQSQHKNYSPNDLQQELRGFIPLYITNRGHSDELALSDMVAYLISSLQFTEWYLSELPVAEKEPMAAQCRQLAQEYSALNQRFADPEIRDYLVSYNDAALQLAQKALTAVSSSRITTRE